MATDDDKKPPALKLQNSPQQNSQQQMPPPPTTNSAATPSGGNPRPVLKLNTSRTSSFSNSEAVTPGSDRKTIKIKVGTPSQPSTPAVPAVKTKAGRSMKPTAKVLESKKRAYESDDEDQPMAATRKDVPPKPKARRISVKTPGFLPPSTPVSAIKFRPKGEPVEHIPGDAYDSEASDREQDPTRESVMVLRTMEGPSTEYLRKALEEGTIGVPKANGGADLNVQFIDAKERRAMVTINGIHYAAVLVDLPTITEAMKSWDRKSMMKNSDVTQMLICFAEVRNEAEAKAVALPALAQETELKWPHGLTPPMHDVVNQRFRKVMSEKQYLSTNARVKQLLEADAAAEDSHVEYIHDSESDSGEDAEGEADDEDYFGPQPTIEEHEDIDEDELLAEFHAVDEHMGEGETPGTQVEAATPAAPANEASDEDEEDEDDEEDDEDEDEEDPEAAAQQAVRREMQEELEGFKKRLKDLETQLQSQTNAIIKSRIQANISSIKKEISVKKAALGITDDE